MPTLTIKLLRKNPWNVVTHSLPARPTRLLLRLAYLAASYCCNSEQLLVFAAREGDYVPAGWAPTPDHPDIEEESQARLDDAAVRLAIIIGWFRDEL